MCRDLCELSAQNLLSIIPAGVLTFHNNLQTLCVSDSSVEQMLLMHYYDKTQLPERYLTKANNITQRP